MEGDFSNLGYTPQQKHDLGWGYYIMDSVPGSWDVLRHPDISQNTIFACFSHPDTYIEYTINEVVFHLNEYTIGFVMRTMETIAKHGWDKYKHEREITFMKPN